MGTYVEWAVHLGLAERVVWSVGVRGRPISTRRLARRFDVSERTLRRRCTAAIGYLPKTLDRILRFRRLLRLVLQRQPLVATAQLAGYVDQAHLTHEFHRLAGAAPGTLYDRPRLVISANGCPT
jgi:transcriptional regulator GlxA family with amidase domain